MGLPNASTILCVWDCAFLARAMSWPSTSCSLAHVCVRCCLMRFDDVRSLMTYKIQSLAFHSSNHVHGRDKTNKLQLSQCMWLPIVISGRTRQISSDKLHASTSGA